jgi:hypothetical protein
MALAILNHTHTTQHKHKNGACQRTTRRPKTALGSLLSSRPLCACSSGAGTMSPARTSDARRHVPSLPWLVRNNFSTTNMTDPSHHQLNRPIRARSMPPNATERAYLICLVCKLCTSPFLFTSHHHHHHHRRRHRRKRLYRTPIHHFPVHRRHSLNKGS